MLRYGKSKSPKRKGFSKKLEERTAIQSYNKMGRLLKRHYKKVKNLIEEIAMHLNASINNL